MSAVSRTNALDILAYSVKIGNVVYPFFPVHDPIQIRLIITPCLCDGVFVYKIRLWSTFTIRAY